MMTCEMCCDLVFDRLDNRLDADVRADMDEHLYTCSSCRDLLDDQEEFDLLLSKAFADDPVSLSQEFADRLVSACQQERRALDAGAETETLVSARAGFLPRWMPMAMAAGFAAMLSLTVLLVQGSSDEAAQSDGLAVAATNMVSHGNLANISNTLMMVSGSNTLNSVQN